MSDQADQPAHVADEEPTGGFEHGSDFAPGEISGGLTLGPLETQYQELFAEVLEDGIITSEERAKLERAADNLGLDRQRLFRLEQAMVAAYESKNKVRVVEHYEEEARSLAPVQIEAAGDTGRALLQKRIEQLEARVRELEDELRDARAHINIEVDLTGLDDDAEDASEDTDEWERRSRREPTKPEPYHRLFRIYEARGDADRRFCVAQALAVLGEATPAEQAVYDAHRAQGLIAPKTSLSPAAW